LRRLSVHIRDVPVSKRGRVTSHRYPDWVFLWFC
jgi:hypothetical protein